MHLDCGVAVAATVLGCCVSAALAPPAVTVHPSMAVTARAAVAIFTFADLMDHLGN
jgi:mannose/fructose/N-acetylgalactosamine-specific phosphotransferase system component IID